MSTQETRQVGNPTYAVIRPSSPTKRQLFVMAHNKAELAKPEHMRLMQPIPECITLKRLSPKGSVKSLAIMLSRSPTKYAKEMQRIGAGSGG